MKYKKNEAKAWAKENLRGLGAAVVTPLLPDGEVDYDGLRKVVRYAIEVGSDVIVCDVSVGEFVSFTVDERKKIVETVVDAVKGERPVVAGAAHHSVKDALELARNAEEVGADAVIIMTPYAQVSGFDPERGIYEYYKYIAERVEIGISLYTTIPAYRTLRPQFVRLLAERIPNICAINMGRADFLETLTVYEMCGDLIVVGDPMESYFPFELMWPFEPAFMFSNPAIYLMQTPTRKPIREYVDLYMKGDHEGGKKKWRELAPLRAVFGEVFGSQFLAFPSSYPVAALKYWQELLGLPGGPTRPPIVQVADWQKKAIREGLIRMGYIKPDHPEPPTYAVEKFK